MPNPKLALTLLFTFLLSLMLSLMLGGCSGSNRSMGGDRNSDTPAHSQAAPVARTTLASSLASAPTETAAARTGRLWARSCALCHVDGNGGAPRMGYREEWVARMQQGKRVLMQNTIHGLNNMPPLGYCMACERQDFSNLIDLMTAGVTKQAEASQPPESQ